MQLSASLMVPSSCGKLAGATRKAVLLPALPMCRPSLSRHVAVASSKNGSGPPEVMPDKLGVVATSGESDKEDSRKFRRVVYNFEKWTRHRSVGRYLENMQSIPSSRILSTLGTPLLALTVFSIAVGCYEMALEAGYLPSWLPTFLLSSPAPQTLTSFALSLLLVFRTNSSYGRFDEARKIWGGTLNHCRNIMQQVMATFPAGDSASAAIMGRWTVAFSYSMAEVVQQDFRLQPDLLRFMSPQEYELLMGAQNRPLKCLAMLSETVQQTQLTPWQRQNLQNEVTFFHDAIGGCERILKTPIPLSYTRHTCRFLIVWLMSLPLGLWAQCHWSMVPIIFVVAVLLLAIEEIGVQIEEPFGILPLDAITERIKIDVKDLLQTSGQVRNTVAELRGCPPADDFPQTLSPEGVKAGYLSQPFKWGSESE